MSTAVDKVTDTSGFIPEHSYLYHLVHNLPVLIRARNQATPVPAYVEVNRKATKKQLFLIGVDPGNSGMKVAMYGSDGRIVTHYMPAVVAQAQEMATGILPTTYYELFEDNSLSIGSWLGTSALRYGASLPTGNTAERLNDPRYIPFLMQGLIELFIKAGYHAGKYEVIICFGVRNQEIRQTAQGSKVLEKVQQALDSRLLKASRCFRRVDEQGEAQDWRVTVEKVISGPQSFAGFSLWYKRPDGKPAAQNVQGVVDLDFGAFDLSRLLIDCPSGSKQKMNVRRDRVGNGMMIDLIQPFADELRTRYGLTDIDDALALQWFLTGKAQIGGFVEDISKIATEVRARQVPAIIANAFKGQQRATDYYRLKGGGVILMHQELRNKMADLGRDHQEDGRLKYLLLPHPYATVENAAGLLANLDLLVRGVQSV